MAEKVPEWHAGVDDDDDDDGCPPRDRAPPMPCARRPVPSDRLALHLEVASAAAAAAALDGASTETGGGAISLWRSLAKWHGPVS